MASNQLRLWFSAFALLLFQRLRTLALRGTELANATAGTLRQRLLKIGALVTVSTRRVYVRLASAFPLQNLFAQVHRALAGRRRLNSRVANCHRFQQDITRRPVSGALSDLVEIRDQKPARFTLQLVPAKSLKSLVVGQSHFKGRHVILTTVVALPEIASKEQAPASFLSDNLGALHLLSATAGAYSRCS
jgi:DDE family transposase